MYCSDDRRALDRVSLKQELLFGSICLILPFLCIYIFSIIGLWLRFSIDAGIVWFALLVSVLILIYIGTYVLGISKRLSSFIICASILVNGMSGFLSHAYYDLSYDGLTYHQQAVLNLYNGWNPIYEPFQWSPGTIDRVIYYAKAVWIVQAGLIKITHSIESTKMIHLSFMLSVGVMMAALAVSWAVRKWYYLLIIFLAGTFHPVAIFQFFTFYVDGIMGSTIVLLIAWNILAIKEKQKYQYVLLFILGIFLLNIKFTGVAYLAIIVAVSCLYIFYREGLKSFIKSVCFWSGTTFLGVIFFGYAPYVENTISKGHPFYPLYVVNSVGNPYYPITPGDNIYCRQIPANYCDANRLFRFVHSLYSRSGYYESPNSSHLKFPFYVEINEVLRFPIADCRVGGFGPLYGLIFTLSTILIVISFFRFSKQNRIDLSILILMLAGTLFIHPFAWMARYVPHFYFYSIIALVCCIKHFGKHQYGRLVVISFGILILLNSGLVTYGIFDQTRHLSSEIDRELSTLENKSIELSLKIESQSIIHRLASRNVKIRLKKSEDLTCLDRKILKSCADFQVCEYCVVK